MIDELAASLFKTSEDIEGVETDNVNIMRDSFVNWWSEGKLDHFEIIKYYLIDTINKDTFKKQGNGSAHMSRFVSYIDKRLNMNVLSDHFENTFTFSVKGDTPAVTKKGVSAATIGKTESTTATGDGSSNLGQSSANT